MSPEQAQGTRGRSAQRRVGVRRRALRDAVGRARVQGRRHRRYARGRAARRRRLVAAARRRRRRRCANCLRAASTATRRGGCATSAKRASLLEDLSPARHRSTAPHGHAARRRVTAASRAPGARIAAARRRRGCRWPRYCGRPASERRARDALRALDAAGRSAARWIRSRAISRSRRTARASSTREGAASIARSSSCTRSTSSSPSRSRRSGQPKGPFASPDGQWIGFFEPGGGAGAALKKVAIGGGPPLEVSRLDGPSRGATWGDDDTIIAASGAPATGLLRIPAAGGDARGPDAPESRARGSATTSGRSSCPAARPSCSRSPPLTGGIDAAQVAVLDLASGTLEDADSWRAARRSTSSSGHLVYVAGGALWAVAFDPARAARRRDGGRGRARRS